MKKNIIIAALVLIIFVLMFLRKTSSMAPEVKPVKPVTLYTDCNYSGKSVQVGLGDYASMDKINFPNDQLSSIMIPEGVMVVLYENDNFGGSSTILKESVVCMKSVILKKYYNWNDRVSSFKVVMNK